MLDVQTLAARCDCAHRDLTFFHWVGKLWHLGEVFVVSVPTVANGWEVLGRHEPRRLCRGMLGREKSRKIAGLGGVSRHMGLKSVVFTKRGIWGLCCSLESPHLANALQHCRKQWWACKLRWNSEATKVAVWLQLSYLHNPMMLPWWFSSESLFIACSWVGTGLHRMAKFIPNRQWVKGVLLLCMPFLWALCCFCPQGLYCVAGQKSPQDISSSCNILEPCYTSRPGSGAHVSESRRYSGS